MQPRLRWLVDMNYHTTSGREQCDVRAEGGSVRAYVDMMRIGRPAAAEFGALCYTWETATPL